MNDVIVDTESSPGTWADHQKFMAEVERINNKENDEKPA